MPKPTHYGYSETTIYQTMDEVHCVIATLQFKVAKFKQPQINAVTTSFLYVLPSLLNDGAKVQIIIELTKNNSPPHGFHAEAKGR